VQRVGGDGPLARGVENALGDHVPGAGVTFLPGLEHEHHRARQFLPPGGQQARRPGQHGRVQVVPAGVHDALGLRGEIQPGPLGHRQRVHVPPQQDDRAAVGISAKGPRALAAQHRGDRAERGPEADLQRQPGQGSEDLALGAGQVEPDLRLAVDGPAQRHQLGGDRLGVITYTHGQPLPVLSPAGRRRRNAPAEGSAGKNA
jgi:hypothetical protein